MAFDHAMAVADAVAISNAALMMRLTASNDVIQGTVAVIGHTDANGLAPTRTRPPLCPAIAERADA